tara:strand:+ start:137 stop:439 length:303 start_codon:yes stop_codon:yes gene_type:complete
MKFFTTFSLIVFCSLFFSAFTTSNIQADKLSVVEHVTIKSEFDKGFEDGWCEGWKDVKGQYSYCPYAPYPPYPTYSQSADSYRDGYNTGFKAGRRKAMNS